MAPTGAVRVVDYKTGRAPREGFEAKAMFQMRFYALVLWRLRGEVPRLLQLLYLGSGEVLRYEPDEADLLATERKLEAIWAAIQRATERGDWRPEPEPALRLVRPPGALPRLRRHPARSAAAPRPDRPAGPRGRRAAVPPHTGRRDLNARNAFRRNRFGGVASHPVVRRRRLRVTLSCAGEHACFSPNAVVAVTPAVYGDQDRSPREETP